jgi:hypothetical protein
MGEIDYGSVKWMFFLKSYISSIFKINYYTILNKKAFYKAIFYFLALLIIVRGASGVREYISFNDEFKAILESFDKEVNELKIEDGIMSIEAEKPVLIKRKDLIIVFDDSNSELEYNEDNYQFSIEFKKEYLSYQYLTIDNENKIFYNILFWENLTKDGFVRFANIYILFINITSIILESLLYFLKMFFYAFIIATIATYMNYFNRIITPFKEVFKLTLYSVTLPLTINLILIILNINVIYFDAFIIVISLIYLLLAYNKIVNEINEKNKKVKNDNL